MWAVKQKMLNINRAHADSGDIHKTEGSYIYSFLTLWGSEHLRTYFFSYLPYKLLYFIYNLLVRNQKFQKNQNCHNPVKV